MTAKAEHTDAMKTENENEGCIIQFQKSHFLSFVPFFLHRILLNYFLCANLESAAV